MPRMLAKRKLTYAGKQILAGAEFDALSRGDEAVLSTLHYAVPIKDANPERPAAVIVKEDSPPEARKMRPKPKRRYRRRDMQAE